MIRRRCGVLVAGLLAGLLLSPAFPPRARGQACASVLEALNDTSGYNFKRTVEAVQRAGLADMLAAGGAFTVFAPDEQAFEKIPAWQVAYAMNHKGIVTDLVEYHIVPGAAIPLVQLARTQTLRTLGGRALPVTVQNGTIVLGGAAKVLNAGRSCSNGIVYAIDAVLRP